MDATFGQSSWQHPCNSFFCGTDYLRVTFTLDLPLRWTCVSASSGDRSRGSDVSHAFLTTSLIGIEALTKTNTKVAADFFLSDRDFPK